MQFRFRILIIFLFVFSCLSVNAEELKGGLSADSVKIQTESCSFGTEYSNAVSKFEKLNIQSSYNDFAKLISIYKNNDFYNVMIGYKTAELGFFDLSQQAFSNINDSEMFDSHYENVRQFYYPAKFPKKEDIIILAELYSNAQYNDQAKETINELGQYTRYLYDYDYANYLLAYSYYKLNDLVNAKKYIQEALNKNPENINYLLLEAKILTPEKKGKISKKIIKQVLAKHITSLFFTQKIDATKEYINYAVSTNPENKDFYLGKYYYAEKDYVKALRVFLTAVEINKKNAAKNYSMVSRCYYALGDYLKAKEYAQKVQKLRKSNPESLIVFGNLEFKKGNYRQALNYYKKVYSNREYKKEVGEKIAETYIKLSNNKAAYELYKEVAKDYPDSYISYYKLSTLDKKYELNYLKKSISVNYMNQDSWTDLASMMLEKKHYKMAGEYLSISKYLDENNFRYYYYQSLLNKAISKN